jgi:hypothetical protein
MLNPEFGPNLRGFVKYSEQIETPAAAAALAIYDQSKEDYPNKFLQYCRIQNVSNTQKVYVCLNDDATLQKYFAILAVDTGAWAGNGGVIVIPGSWNLTKISVLTPAAGIISVAMILNCNPNRIVN